MCLETLTLNLKYDKEEKAFVGYGYKSLEYEKLSKYRDGKWHKATGAYPSVFNTNPQVDFDRTEKAVRSSIYDDKDNNVREYWPGFHIFLRMEDAVQYNNGYYNNYAREAYSPKSGKRLILVQYKFVTAFGTNSTSTGNSGPCVIAQEMKYIKTIKYADAKRLAYVY